MAASALGMFRYTLTTLLDWNTGNCVSRRAICELCWSISASVSLDSEARTAFLRAAFASFCDDIWPTAWAGKEEK